MLKWPTSFDREDIVGLDVADRFVTAARVRLADDGSPELTHAGYRELAPDAPPDDVAEALRGLWRETRMPTRTVCSCIHSRGLALKPFRHEHLSNDELASALKLEAEELLQVAPDLLHLDWFLNKRNGSSGNGTKEGIFVAVPRVDVEQHMRLLRSAGLYPVIVDVASVSLANLYGRLHGPPRHGEAVCLVNVAQHTADMAMLSAGPYVYPRTVISLAQSWGDALSHLVGHIEDVLQYFHRKLGRETVRKVLFAGDLPFWDDLSEQVTERLGLAAERWNPAAVLPRVNGSETLPPGLQDEQGAVLATSLGLALRGASSV